MFEITILLPCKHINIVQIESVVNAPQIGDKYTCKICKKKGAIISRGNPYQMMDTAPNPTIDRDKK